MIPPADTGDRHPGAAEALGLLPAWRRTYERYDRTTVGKVVTPEQVPDMVDIFVRVAEGEDWKTVGLPGDPTKIAADIRNFYEEASLSLIGGTPDARQAETWFVDHTQAGRIIQQARIAMKESGANFYFWYYLLPLTQHHEL